MATKSGVDKLTSQKAVDITPDSRPWYRDFIEQLVEFPNVSRACAYAGVSRQAAYQARDVDAQFRAAWDMCIEASIDKLEEEAFRRANENSDTLAIFLLKAHRPERYQEKASLELSGPDGQPLTIALTDKIIEGSGGGDGDS